MVVSRPSLAREVASAAAVETRSERAVGAGVHRHAADRQADTAAADRAAAADLRRAEMQRSRL